MAENPGPVEAHYTRPDLGEIIVAALKAAGKDLDHLTPDDLAPVDEFHGGQRPATVRLGELVGFSGNERVLDVGSGLGGPSRYIAWRYGCRVSGIDLTAEFVRVAEMLTRRTGLTARVDYRQGDALDLPFDDQSFEVVWSREPLTSFLLPQPVIREKLEMAGFRVLVWQDTTEEARQAAHTRARSVEGPPPVLGTHLIIGDDWRAMFRNSARNLEERRTELFNAVLTR